VPTPPVARTVTGLIGHVCSPQWITRHLRPTFTLYFLAGHGIYFPYARQMLQVAEVFLRGNLYYHRATGGT
jgi:hypothetical protein